MNRVFSVPPSSALGEFVDMVMGEATAVFAKKFDAEMMAGWDSAHPPDSQTANRDPIREPFPGEPVVLSGTDRPVAIVIGVLREFPAIPRNAADVLDDEYRDRFTNGVPTATELAKKKWLNNFNGKTVTIQRTIPRWEVSIRGVMTQRRRLIVVRTSPTEPLTLDDPDLEVVLKRKMGVP